MNVKEMIKVGKAFTTKNSPTILTVLNTVGLAVTMYSSFKAGLKAHDALEERHEMMEELELKKMPEDQFKKERRDINVKTLKKIGPVMIAPIAAASCSAAAGIASNVINQKRLVKLGTALAITETAYTELKEKATEVIGEKKMQSIKDAITKDKIDEHEAPELPSKYDSYEGEKPELCYDTFSGRYFYTTAKDLNKAISRIGHQCYVGSPVTVADLYMEIGGLEPTPPSRDFGWTADDLYGDGELPINITAQLTKDDRPCLVLNSDDANYLRRH